MFNPTSARLITCCLILFSLFVFTIPGHLSARASKKTNLVVHEWGTFTSVAGTDEVTLEWRPLNVESDLPSFVHSVDRLPRATPQPQPPQPTTSPRIEPQRPAPRPLTYPTKSGARVSVRMETPVLYFYAKEETTLKVRVDFPGGKITEWYPGPLRKRRLY